MTLSGAVDGNIQWQASTNGGASRTNVGTGDDTYNPGSLTQATSYRVVYTCDVL